MRAYSEQIVYTPSEDQRTLAGVLIRPTAGTTLPLGVVCLHVAVNHFYAPLLVHLGRALAQRGYRCVSGNTRGHDLASVDYPWVSSATRADPAAGLRLGGNGWARWDEEAHDVAGWLNFLVSQGVEQVVLMGTHGAGVRRITYYQAQRQDSRVVGMVLVSGADRVTPVNPTELQLAEQLVAEGKEDALLPVAEGVPMIFALQSAASLVHWERHAGRFSTQGHLPWIASVRVPLLATGGTDDEYDADLE